MSTFPHIVAQKQGSFEQQGFEVELILVTSGTPAVQAVIAGDLDFATTGNVATLAALRGAPIAQRDGKQYGNRSSSPSSSGNPAR